MNKYYNENNTSALTATASPISPENQGFLHKHYNIAAAASIVGPLAAYITYKKIKTKVKGEEPLSSELTSHA